MYCLYYNLLPDSLSSNFQMGIHINNYSTRFPNTPLFCSRTSTFTTATAQLHFTTANYTLQLQKLCTLKYALFVSCVVRGSLNNLDLVSLVIRLIVFSAIYIYRVECVRKNPGEQVGPNRRQNSAGLGL